MQQEQQQQQRQKCGQHPQRVSEAGNSSDSRPARARSRQPAAAAAAKRTNERMSARTNERPAERPANRPTAERRACARAARAFDSAVAAAAADFACISSCMRCDDACTTPKRSVGVRAARRTSAPIADGRHRARRSSRTVAVCDCNARQPVSRHAHARVRVFSLTRCPLMRRRRRRRFNALASEAVSLATGFTAEA